MEEETDYAKKLEAEKDHLRRVYLFTPIFLHQFFSKKYFSKFQNLV